MNIFSKIFHSILNSLFPPQCLLCKNFIQLQGELCKDCWKNLEFIQTPHCTCCGMPFTYASHVSLCVSCSITPPSYDEARAVIKYRKNARKLVKDFKYHDSCLGVGLFGTWMAHVGKDLLQHADYLVPIPLHPMRLWKRRYNQSALLCKAVHLHYPVPILYDLLIRKRNTKPQSTLSKRKRKLNVKNAFALHEKHRIFLENAVKRKGEKGLHIVIVDDVRTTGATVEECAVLLKSLHVKRISILTLSAQIN